MSGLFKLGWFVGMLVAMATFDVLPDSCFRWLLILSMISYLVGDILQSSEEDTEKVLVGK